MLDLIKTDGDVLTTTSKIIADVFGKPHRTVLRGIASLDCSEEFSRHNYVQSDYLTGRGKTYQCFNITEDGFYFLAMGFTGRKAGKWKEAFLKEFKRLRAGTLNIDQRMTELSNRLNLIKENGQAWSELGRVINKSKKKAVIESQKLLSDVQMELDY